MAVTVAHHGLGPALGRLRVATALLRLLDLARFRHGYFAANSAVALDIVAALDAVLLMLLGLWLSGWWLLLAVFGAWMVYGALRDAMSWLRMR